MSPPEFRIGPADDPDLIRLGPAVASGAEGVLYRATFPLEEGAVDVAVKMLQPGHLDQLRAWTARWREQVELLSRVAVPGLVGVRGGFVGPLPHTEGQADASTSSLYLVMDWVEGVPLDRWARAVEVTEPEQLLLALVPVAAALDLLHSGAATGGVAVIHRDVKPANILMRPAGDTVLVDVGSARGLDDDSRRSGVVGTPGYIAPEVRADGDYGPASDRYALGAVAFFLLTGDEPPIDAEHDELRERLAQALLLQGRPELVDHVLVMLDPDPAVRPESLANWVAQLRRSSLAALPGDVALAPRAPARSTAVGREEHPSRRQSGSRRMLVLGAVVAVIATSVGILALRRDSGGSGGSTLTATEASASRARLTFVRGADSDGRGSDAEIYTADLSGRHLRRLTKNEAPDGSPAWSPDGSRIAFSSMRDGGASEIYVMASDGSNTQRLTTDPAEDNDPDWSPDGTELAFVSDRTGADEIHVINLRDGTTRRLTTDGCSYGRQGATRQCEISTSSSAPSWSPSGGLIAYTKRAGTSSSVALIRVDQPANTSVASAGDVGRAKGAAHVGASRVMLMRAEDDSQPSADSDVGTQITKDVAHVGASSMSSDGNRVAFEDNAGPDGGGLYTVTISGTQQERVANTTSANGCCSLYSNPVWLPGDRELLAESPSADRLGLYRLPLDGSRHQRITAGDDHQPDIIEPRSADAVRRRNEIVKSVDWSNRRYEHSCAPGPVTIKSGEFADEASLVQMKLVEPTIADFDDDGLLEAAIHLACAAGNATSEIVVYFDPRLDAVSIGAAATAVSASVDIDREGQEFVAYEPDIREGESRCCPSHWRRSRYRYDPISSSFSPYGESELVRSHDLPEQDQEF